MIDIRQVLSESIGTEKHDYYATQAEIFKSLPWPLRLFMNSASTAIRSLPDEEKTGIAAEQWSILKEWVETETPAKAILSWVKGIRSRLARLRSATRR